MSDHFPVIMELRYDSNTSSIKENIDNDKSKLSSIKDLLGRTVKVKKNSIQFYIYENGKVEKKIIIN